MPNDKLTTFRRHFEQALSSVETQPWTTARASIEPLLLEILSLQDISESEILEQGIVTLEDFFMYNANCK